MNDVLKTHPAVFAVGNVYKIFVPVTKPVLMWAEVGGKTFHDHVNGILRSDTAYHCMTVPAKLLDSCREYAICWRVITERLPYYTKTLTPESVTYSFKPLEKTDGINIIHISDTHGLTEKPISAGKHFGDDLDLLVLNGDLPDHCGDTANFAVVYELASGITGGSVPVIFSRGNHDMRGAAAEKFFECVPSDDGKSYYTFRLGCVWGVVLDCGEDKADDCDEYGNTVCCREFREQETEFMKKVAESGEAHADGIEYRLAICHNPFSHTLPPPFDIEQDTYAEWCKLLEIIKPTVMLCGHLHFCRLFEKDTSDKFDAKHIQPCDVIIGSAYKNETFSVAAVTLSDGGYKVEFVSS